MLFGHTLVCIDSYAMQAQSVKQCVEHRPLRAAGEGRPRKQGKVIFVILLSNRASQWAGSWMTSTYAFSLAAAESPSYGGAGP